ncbi:MAG: hypothetical protein A0129_15040 [Limnobacter sp. CACIAM 66H1]|uniref:NAD-dependent epimerase/dehydratase family protein n=1 Tax=Limnobacter sp. CACIAM 66H1 TaxID=1813033 RepID=UPI0007A7EB9D|nr:NAD-dependent epimerase/dehydratase family protein [Limnobacter sp. CACIAM 66H1]KYP10050.1 MAG: hypothetical protein A0129_15040 [Limnobacter sp. CACIAM 66H1]
MNVMIISKGSFISRSLAEALWSVEGLNVTVVAASLTTRENLRLPNAAFADQFIEKFKPDILINCMGGLDPRSNPTMLDKFIERYLIDYLGVVEAGFKRDLKLVIDFSSANEITSNSALTPVELNDTNIYRSLKISIEQFVSSLAILHKKKYAILRCGNIIGVGYSRNGFGVVEVFARKILEGEEPVFFSDSIKRKDYVSISDLVRGVKEIVLCRYNISKFVEIFEVKSGYLASAREIYSYLLSYFSQGEGSPLFDGLINSGSFFKRLGITPVNPEGDIKRIFDALRDSKK